MIKPLIRTGVYTPLQKWTDDEGILAGVDFEVVESADRTLGAYARIHSPMSKLYVETMLDIFTKGQRVYTEFNPHHTVVGLLFFTSSYAAVNQITTCARALLNNIYVQPMFAGIEQQLIAMKTYLRGEIHGK